ncbi:MAG: glycosyltransferase family 2 protein [Candidatus Harrisonbacteria bacterium]|nr:glycosyltransferase family 2 protein [Candidatus Harrisonbacteria bacterium]
MTLSLILPIYNEEKNLPSLFERIEKVMSDGRYDYEVIAIDDGSKDSSLQFLKKVAGENLRWKLISFYKNYGQTAALQGGIEHASGDIIIPLDSDLENHPEDIPLLLQKMREGYDLVSGWRLDRWRENPLSRRLPSLIANKIISFVTGISLHDYGCTLKAYKREVIVDLPLYGEMHRFLPAYAARRGAKITEIPVRYSPRASGKSNYGLSRTFRVLLDLLVIHFLDRYLDRPIHFFGGGGLLFIFGSLLSGLYAIYLKAFAGTSLIRTPLPILSAFLFLSGFNFILMGLISELLIRTHTPLSPKNSKIKEKVNF